MDDEDDALALWDLVSDLVLMMRAEKHKDRLIEEAYWTGVADGIAATILGDSTALKS